MPDLEDKISLREFFDTKIDFVKQLFELQISSIKEATGLAKTEIDKRLEGMNEFRDALRDQTNQFVMKSELKVMIDNIEKDLQIFRENKTYLEGKLEGVEKYKTIIEEKLANTMKSKLGIWVIVIMIISLMISIAGYFK